MSRGSAIAKVAGENIVQKPEKFTAPITMYVYEEMVDGRKLSEIINTDHENPKYMPGIKLPDNVVSAHYTVQYCIWYLVCIFVSSLKNEES